MSSALDGLLERRYVGLVRLASGIAEAWDWEQLAAAISHGLEDPVEESLRPAGVRFWAVVSEGFEELSRFPLDHAFPPVHPRKLQRAVELGEPLDDGEGRLLIGLQAAGVTLGVLEVDAPAPDGELLAHAAPIVASRASVLAAQGIGDVLIAPSLSAPGTDPASLMAKFAAEANRLLEHDRLSAYLLTHDGRAFERFAVATSALVPGEGVIIPFEDVGLRHIVINNRALVSDDLCTDPRIVGREDRVVARGGFHGLLSVPLRRNGRPFGVLNFVSRTPGFYREDDIPVAQQIADQVSAFVENLYVQRRMQMLTRHEAAEQERSRVARELYHAIAQAVPEIEAVAGALRGRMGDRDPEGAALAERVHELAQMQLTEVRRAVAGLLPHALDAHSLDEAIEQTIASLGDDAPRVSFKVLGDTAALSGAASRSAFRIFQEALANARIHAGASKIDVSLSVGRDLELVVADDGAGYEQEEPGRSSGLGLQFMRERAQALGGVLTIDSTPGKGTSVRLQLLGVSDLTEQAPAPEEAPGPGTATLRVFVAEQNHLVRSGLIRVLERSGDMRLVGEAGTAEEAKGQLKRMRPDVVLLDAQLANGRLPLLVREIRDQLPAAAVLALTERDNGAEPELLEAGVTAVADKGMNAQNLLELVRSLAGGAPAAPAAAAASEAKGTGILTPRERSILALVAAGETNNEIGKKLFLATKTVERHVATIVRKLGARNRAHAAAVAVAKRLVDLPGS